MYNAGSDERSGIRRGLWRGLWRANDRVGHPGIRDEPPEPTLDVGAGRGRKCEGVSLVGKGRFEVADDLECVVFECFETHNYGVAGFPEPLLSRRFFHARLRRPKVQKRKSLAVDKRVVKHASERVEKIGVAPLPLGGPTVGLPKSRRIGERRPNQPEAVVGGRLGNLKPRAVELRQLGKGGGGGEVEGLVLARPRRRQRVLLPHCTVGLRQRKTRVHAQIQGVQRLRRHAQELGRGGQRFRGQIPQLASGQSLLCFLDSSQWLVQLHRVGVIVLH